uniref:Uncharacterized protein n=1 Tax=Triticum urartu TaxID=4572 RepID=A0A8R7UGM9_TRIUA
MAGATPPHTETDAPLSPSCLAPSSSALRCPHHQRHQHRSGRRRSLQHRQANLKNEHTPATSSSLVAAIARQQGRQRRQGAAVPDEFTLLRQEGLCTVVCVWGV